jgi:hypothetical protein
MSKSPVSFDLNGLTAAQMKALIGKKKVTAQTVVAFLQAKEAAHGLRFPARELLAELAPPVKATKPAKPGKPAKVVAPPPVKAKVVTPTPAKPGKVAAKVVAPAFDAEGVIKRLDALERVVSALVERFAPAKPAANRRKAS